MDKRILWCEGAGIVCLIFFACIVPSSLWKQAQNLQRSQQDVQALVSRRQNKEAVLSDQTEQPVSETFDGVLIFVKDGLMLPILSRWEESSYSAGVFSGSVHTRDLILSGHNDPSQFRSVMHLNLDDEVQILDEDQTLHSYRVSRMETLKPNELEKLTGQEPDRWDLTLFTCTYDNLARRVIRLQEAVQTD
ncbi:MAG: sortase [Ileibacterium sp.]|nr:sortase [Ileibacterium sp.]